MASGIFTCPALLPAGFTFLYPELSENIRGTYAALAHPVTIKYLKQLGVTAVELMPVHHFVSDRHLVERGLINYWGYNTIGFFAPDVRYSASGVKGEQVKEFKTMVKELHKAGIEVILDVVYNHTAEGNHYGPTLSFRGADNLSYYRLTQENKRYYDDYTGTGNTLNAGNPNVLRLIMDSLRYWITEMHVDGFRFDLAPALVRELRDADRLNAFFDIIHQDPLISQVKLIAEPWDITETGYLLGKFPPEWAEWNDKYRDCMRDYWRGAESKLGEFAARFAGSADLYENTNRQPTSSINFITAYDGFTLRDLVSYNEKHNEANGEEHWQNGYAKSIGVYLQELESHNNDPLNEMITRENFYCIFNAHHEQVAFNLPGRQYGQLWKKMVDTSAGSVKEGKKLYHTGEVINAPGRSMILLKSSAPKVQANGNGEVA